jgi:hypothetical protein
MRVAAALLLLAFVGCLAADDAPQDAPVRAAATQLTLPSCVPAGQAFDIVVRLVNEEPRAGSALLLVDAQQWGHLVNERVHLEANETRDVRETAAIGLAGPWQVYVSSPDPRVAETRLRVSDGPC